MFPLDEIPHDALDRRLKNVFIESEAYSAASPLIPKPKPSDNPDFEPWKRQEKILSKVYLSDSFIHSIENFRDSSNFYPFYNTFFSNDGRSVNIQMNFEASLRLGVRNFSFNITSTGTIFNVSSLKRTGTIPLLFEKLAIYMKSNNYPPVNIIFNVFEKGHSKGESRSTMKKYFSSLIDRSELNGEIVAYFWKEPQIDFVNMKGVSLFFSDRTTKDFIPLPLRIDALATNADFNPVKENLSNTICNCEVYTNFLCQYQIDNHVKKTVDNITLKNWAFFSYDYYGKYLTIILSAISLILVWFRLHRIKNVGLSLIQHFTIIVIYSFIILYLYWYFAIKAFMAMLQSDTVYMKRNISTIFENDNVLKMRRVTTNYIPMLFQKLK